MRVSAATVPTFRRVMMIIITLCIISPVAAQEKISFSDRVLECTRNILDGTRSFIEETLDGKDSIYVSPNLYNLTIMPQYSYGYDYYRFSSKEHNQSIALSPGSSNKIGLYLGWRWIFLGYSFDLSDSDRPQTDLNFSFYTSALGIDLFYRKRSEGYQIRMLKGFYEEGTDGTNRLTTYDRNFDGLTVKQFGTNLYYIFNNKKFSYPAAYSQSTNQRISAGSFILGLSYNEQSFLFDYSKFDAPIREQLSEGLKFKNVEYKDFSINFGYSYNWVFAKDFLANLSLTPAIGYKNTSLRLANSKEFLSSINMDLITRAAIVYNNSRYYAGASLVAHTYSYSKNALSIVNGFGVINVYFGVNFWRRK